MFTATAIAVAVYTLWTDQIREQVSEQLQKNTEAIALSVNNELIYEQNNLRAWSQLDVMIDIISDDLDKRIINTLFLLKDNYQLAGDLILVNDKNTVIASTTQKVESIGNSSERVTLSGDLTHDAQLIMRMPVKLSIMPEETVSGYLLLTHPWQNIVQHMTNSLGEFLIHYEEKLILFNETGPDIISHTGQVNAERLYWELNGLEKIHSDNVELTRLLSPPVSVYGIVNKETALQPIETTLRLIGMVTLLLLFPIAFLSIWSSNRFLKPIIELQQAAEEITRSGDLGIKIPIRNFDEIGKLAHVLNRMTSNLNEAFEKNERSNFKLQQLTEHLELRVKERTQELSQTLEKLKKTQSQLVQSEKMSSLGLLVAGIAHELNNPISSVHVNIPMLSQYVEDLVGTIDFINENLKDNETLLSNKLQDIDYEFVKEDIFALLNAQADAAKRIRDIVLSLRTFSRLDEAEIKTIDINAGIDNTLNILRHEIKDRVAIHKNYQLQHLVECFPGEINQVILNIIGNAAQAIDGKGNIWIETSLIESDFIRIQITDDGPGMSEDVISMIFDPFFTTKSVGVGTGLGLSISYGIIENHHGRIFAENVEPHGAKFTIEIPLKQSTSQ